MTDYIDLSLDSQNLKIKTIDNGDDTFSLATSLDNLPLTSGVNTGEIGVRVFIGPTDPISDLPIVIDFPHHQLHEGETYQYSWYGAVNNTSKDFRISVPALTATTRTPHLLPEFICDATALFYLYEGTTFTAGGVEDTAVYNRNRNSSNTPGTKIYVSGGTALTPNVLGTNIWKGWTIASARAANNFDRATTEWDLKSNTEYLFRVTTTGNANVLVRFDWYEDLGV